MNWRRKSILVGTLLVSSVIYGRTLDLKNALILAEKGNPNLKIQKLEIVKKKLEVDKKKKTYLPKFVAKSNYHPVKNEDGDKGWGDSRIDAIVPLYTGGLRPAELAKSRLDSRIEEENLDILYHRVKEEVVHNYFNILNLKKNIKVNNSVIKTLEKQRSRLKSMFDGGKLIPKSELLKVESDLLRSKTEKYT